MKALKNTLFIVTALSLLCVARAADNPAQPADARAQSQAKANQQAEQQRKDAEQQAQKSLDQEAVAAIQETKSALQALEQGKTDEALAAIERATGKINVLTSRNPATALIPAAVEVDIIDAAPMDVNQIRDIGKAAKTAVSDKDYPAARVLLASLISEIRTRTYDLPLATYPIALQEAARAIDQKKNDQAATLIRTALNTLVIIDRAEPLPIVTAQAAIDEAQAQRDKDKNVAQAQLTVAKTELERAKELGYAGNDPEYAALNAAISDVEKQLKGGQDSTGAFAKLKEKVSSFFKRQSSSEKKSEVASR
jgi:hypothetical protein